VPVVDAPEVTTVLAWQLHSTAVASVVCAALAALAG
jgi:hypothetical protein